MIAGLPGRTLSIKDEAALGNMMMMTIVIIITIIIFQLRSSFCDALYSKELVEAVDVKVHNAAQVIVPVY